MIVTHMTLVALLARLISITKNNPPPPCVQRDAKHTKLQRNWPTFTQLLLVLNLMQCIMGNTPADNKIISAYGWLENQFSTGSSIQGSAAASVSAKPERSVRPAERGLFLVERRRLCVGRADGTNADGRFTSRRSSPFSSLFSSPHLLLVPFISFFLSCHKTFFPPSFVYPVAC